MKSIKKKIFSKVFYKKAVTFFLLLDLLGGYFFPIGVSFSPAVAYANTSACTTSADPVHTHLSPRVGGVALDMAAQFLSNMKDFTGAYYDTTLDRIVFVGKTNSSLPQFNRDDMAVAIKAIVFNNTIPAVSINYDPNNENQMKVTFFGGIENSNFGNVLFNADFKMKHYSVGYDAQGNKTVSTVPGYKSFFDRYIAYNPNPNLPSSMTRFWITPQLITLKKDDANSAFVFDTVKMQVKTEPLDPNNDPAINQAASDFANEQTADFDAYTQESPEYLQVKQLGKLTAIIKWIYDSGIGTDFNWAHDYTIKKIMTPTSIPALFSPVITQNGHTFKISGGVQYTTPNSYAQDTSGSANAIKTNAQQISTVKQDVHWQFTQNGQVYDAVAIAADAFRSLGGYNTTVTDMSVPIAGDLQLAFQRSYSSYSGGQNGIGTGWSFLPARLLDNKPNYTTSCIDGSTHITALSFDSSSGHETFTYNCSTNTYIPDDTAFHTKIVQNSNGVFTATLSNQVQYLFDAGYKLTKILDKNANAILYAYDINANITTISDNKNHQLTLAYNGQGLITSVTDWAGRSTQYSYDGNNNLTSVKDPNGNATAYAYDGNNKLTAITDKNGQQIITNTYGQDARLATQKDASGVTTTYTKDDMNKAITAADTLGRSTKISYDTKARVLQQTDPLNKSSINTYGAEYAPVTVTDKNGNKTTYTYDSNGNTTSITYPDNSSIAYTYDTNNRVTKILDNRYATPAKETNYTYDGNGNLTQRKEAGLVSSYTYDPTGEVLTAIDPLNHATTWTRDNFGNDLTETDSTSKTTAFQYDIVGRLTKQIDANTNAVSYTYDNSNNVLTKTTTAGTATTTYDKENRPIKITLPDNTITTYAYNPAGSLISVIDPQNTVSNYGYDAYQNNTTQQDALNNTTTNIYDKLNRETQSTTPLGKVSKWIYDANGNILARIDANNATTNYQYDGLNHLTKITYPDTKTVTFTYDSRGNRTKMIDPIGTTTFIYDPFDRLTQATDDYNHTIAYAYDTADNLKTITYPDNTVSTYNYDTNNRLTSVVDFNNKTTFYTYNNNGTLATRTYPNTIVTTYGYDTANRLISLTNKLATTTVAQFNYTRNPVGNITIATESGTFISSTPQTTKFTYDASGKVLSGVYPSNQSFSYVYDKVGNRLSQTINDPTWGPKTDTFTYDQDDKLTKKNTFTNFTYDNNGNQTKKPSENANPDWTFAYDFENRMTALKTSAGNPYTYLYDGIGNRLQKQMQTATTRYVTDMSGSMSRILALASSQGSGGITTKYSYGLDLIGDDGQHYNLEDGLGNVRIATNANGSKGSSSNYDPYGNVYAASGLTQPFQFQKQWQDSESNLLYLRARYYDPSTGRFMSKDPVSPVLVQPQSMNPYQYAYNNPVNLSDPSGKFAGVDDVVYLTIGACAVGAGYVATQPSIQKAIAGAVSSISTLLNKSNQGSKISGEIKKAGTDVTNDPGTPPGSNWKWSGNDKGKGAWTRGTKAEGTKESLSPDLNNPAHLPHTDYTNSQGQQFRIYPDGTIEPK